MEEESHYSILRIVPHFSPEEINGSLNKHFAGKTAAQNTTACDAAEHPDMEDGHIRALNRIWNDWGLCTV
jgi:hypothetical protein